MSERAMANEEIEYESDPEEAKLSLKMRRREASDDEEEDGEKQRAEIGKNPPRRIDDSDGESEGAAAEYEDEELEEEELDDYDLDEDYVEEGMEETKYEQSGGAGGGDGLETLAVVRAEPRKEGAGAGKLIEERKGVIIDSGEICDQNNNLVDGQHEEEKKEIEPFAVPTAGAFYMHDDRFGGNAGGRHRRTLGGRKLWESEDDRKWGHDKFEELTMQEKHHEERRRGSRGRFRDRGRDRGSEGGYTRGNKPREYNNNSSENNSNQNNAPKDVRGRGPRRYQPSFKNSNEAPRAHSKLTTKSNEKPSYVNSVRNNELTSNTEPNMAPPRKQVFASNLNVASPPFYPSGSSTKDNTLPQKRDAQTGTINGNGQPRVVEESFMMHTNTMMRGKNRVDSIGMDNLYIDDSLCAMTGKPSNLIPMPLPGSSSVKSTQLNLRSEGRRIAPSSRMSYQPAVSSNQVSRAGPASQLQATPRNPNQNRVQSSVQATGQQFIRMPSGTQTSSPPKNALAASSFESGEMGSLSESIKSKIALAAKAKDSMQGGGKSSFLYGGPQVMGPLANMGSGRGDQNFPAFLPVVQFGGQHPGGVEVPAVGMAFPGYVAQPQLGGLGNSEMTWLPVLTGAAGALGASYCPPYITVDDSYNPHPSGQASSTVAASSKDNSGKVSNDWKPAQKPDLAKDEFGQRQKNPRRYTEMKFDQ